MKNILWLLLVCLVYGCGSSDSNQPRKKPPVVKPKPETPKPKPTRPIPTTELAPPMAVGKALMIKEKVTQLRGLNIADPWHIVKRNHRYDPGRTNFLLDFVGRAVDLGGNVVRIPLLQRDRYAEGYLDWRERYDADLLDPLVDYLTERGQYIIIDCHYVQDWDRVSVRELNLFWDRIVAKYGRRPNIIFEVFNEPINPDDWSKWHQYISPVIHRMRANTNNLIIVGGPYWSSHMAGADSLPIEADNLSYTAHIYCNQGEYALENNYPKQRHIFVSEWGFEKGGTEDGDLSWGRKFHQKFLWDKSWTMWCYDNAWGPRMIINDKLTDAGKFYQEIVRG